MLAARRVWGRLAADGTEVGRGVAVRLRGRRGASWFDKLTHERNQFHHERNPTHHERSQVRREGDQAPRERGQGQREWLRQAYQERPDPGKCSGAGDDGEKAGQEREQDQQERGRASGALARTGLGWAGGSARAVGSRDDWLRRHWAYCTLAEYDRASLADGVGWARGSGRYDCRDR